MLANPLFMRIDGDISHYLASQIFASTELDYIIGFGVRAREKMKRSAYVQLILLGSAMGLYACDDVRQDLKQQKYASLDECRHDWGDPADCRQSSAATGQPAYYYGPRYYWDPNRARPIAVNGDGTTRSIHDAHITSAGSESGVTTRVGTFSRGGFGSSAHGFGAGGS
jgi:uncharacterized protein YgiB involved in biofilm formation